MGPIGALEIVGGTAVVGVKTNTTWDLIQAVRRGFPVQAVEHMIEGGWMTPAEIDQVIMPRKTLSHRRKIGTLTPEQSDRLMRAARVIAQAVETFGTKEKAAAWLRRPTAALGGERPLSLLDTTEGAHQIETLLGRIAHGIAA